MFKSTKEFDLAMKEILVHIRDENSIDELLKNIDYFDSFVECVKTGLIQGVTFWVDGSGKINIENFHPRITRLGLEFIETN